LKPSTNIAQTIKDLSFDLKAEAVIADLVQNGLENDDFVVVPAGTFRRRYSRDIASAGNLELKNGTKILAVNLNRDAIYDNLPEGFFHQNSEQNTGSKNISKESKIIKEEEKVARKFFLPFENEIFAQRVSLELEERRILNRFSENLADDFSAGFWRLDQSPDHRYLSQMVKFMHISHKIAGNTGLTENCLSAILRENVTATLQKNCVPVKANRKNVTGDVSTRLGYAMLGVDFICGSEFTDLGYTMRFDIGPLRNSGINDYLENGPASKFLQCFFGYFIPAETEVSVHVFVAPEEMGFTLEPHGDGAVLGYKTAI
jgi:hypothetical protein